MPEIRLINPVIEQGAAKLRVAAYCRVSSDSADQLNSYIAQVDYYTKLIGGNEEWELADIYADEGLTGTHADKREDFQRLLRDCRKGMIDKVLTKSISRFARNTRDCLKSVRELKALGVEVAFEKENLNTGAMASEMFLSMHGASAQEESISISNNQRWSYERRMQSGRFITCRAPYGYRLSKGEMTSDDAEAEIIRRIFADYLAGKGKQEIADELSRERVPKWNGATDWLYKTVDYILKNEKYTGDVLLQKRYTTDTLPFKQVRNRGEKAKYHVQNSHPAIISQADFEQAQKLNASQNVLPAPYKPKRYPLSKKIVCGECGHTFKRKTCGGITYWVCYNHNLKKENCSVKQIPEAEIHTAFIRLWGKLKQNHRHILAPLLDGLLALRSRMTMSNVKVGEINREIAELTEQNLILNRLRSKGYMDSAIFMEQANEISGKINRLRALRRKLLEKDEDDHTIADLKALIEILDDGADSMAEFDEAVFHSMVDKIIVESQEKIRFRLIGGVELTEHIQRIGR